MKNLVVLISLSCGLLASNTGLAAEWGKTSVSVLKGNDFEVGEKSRTVFRVTQVSGLKYGDSYFFLDVTDPQPREKNNSRVTQLYGEWSPRMSLGKVFDFYDGKRFLRDLLISTNIEFGNNGFSSQRSRLMGLGVDLGVPMFDYFSVNFLMRDNLQLEGTTSQVSLNYGMHFPVGTSKLVYSSYFDFVLGDEGDEDDGAFAKSHWHSSHQVVADMGAFAGSGGSIYLGVEYQIWRSKYGIPEGPDEDNLQAVLKWDL